MITIEELAARLDRVETELALHRLAYDYCVGADHRDLPRWAAVWTADAVWETSPDQIFTGIEAICAAVEQQWQAFPIMQHATANHTVTIDGDTATGRSDVVVLVQLRDGRWIAGGGTYLDQYRREPDGWRITRRQVTRPFDLAPLPPSPGPIHIDND
jgi:ketosteroid isomerase-like protein